MWPVIYVPKILIRDEKKAKGQVLDLDHIKKRPSLYSRISISVYFFDKLVQEVYPIEQMRAHGNFLCGPSGIFPFAGAGINRPDVRDVDRVDVLRDKRKRDERIHKAVQEHGYVQREVLDHLGMHFNSINRILGKKQQILTCLH